MNQILNTRSKTLFQRISPFLPIKGQVLDIGCGTGHNAREIRDRTALDVYEADVENMKILPPPPIIFNGYDLPFENDSFQCVLLLFVLHYCKDIVSLLQEIRRVTSGALIVLQSTYVGIIGKATLQTRDWVEGTLAFYVARLVGLIGKYPCPLHPREFLERERLETMFNQAGWSITYFEPQYWPFVKVSRDLYVLGEQ